MSDKNDKNIVEECEKSDIPFTVNDSVVTQHSNVEQVSSNDDNFDNDDEDDDQVISIANLNEYMEAENEAINTSIAVLGSFNDKQCSYNLIEIPQRQAIFSCATCETSINPETGEKYQAGFCYACSVNCHKDHKIYELWTKRTFNCDCGCDRFKNFTCQLFDKKGFLNETNLYNHNFDGLYCLCNKEAFANDCSDDPKLSEQSQCVICEDWFHLPHIEPVRKCENFEDIICFQCIEQHPFFVYYFDPYFNSSGKKRKLEESETHQTPESSKNSCILKKLREEFKNKHLSDDVKKELLTSYAVEQNWRKSLCHCNDCIEMYNDRQISFLTVDEDSITTYTDKTKKERQTDLYDQAYSKLSHTQKIAVITLKQKLNRFFVDFNTKKPGVTMTVDDVKEFVEKELKRPKLF